MSKIIRWIERTFFPPKRPIVQVRQSSFMTAKADDSTYDLDRVNTPFDPTVSGRIDSPVRGQNILKPYLHAEDNVPTEPILKIIDQASSSPATIDTSSGFNPYDTGVLQAKPGSGKH